MWFTQLKRQKSTPATDPLPQAPNLRQKAKCRPPAARDTKAAPVCSIPVPTSSCPCSASCAAASSSEHCSQAAKQASCAGERNVKRRKEERTTKSNNKNKNKIKWSPSKHWLSKAGQSSFRKTVNRRKWLDSYSSSKNEKQINGSSVSALKKAAFDKTNR